jgi:hypothetical protein
MILLGRGFFGFSLPSELQTALQRFSGRFPFARFCAHFHAVMGFTSPRTPQCVCSPANFRIVTGVSESSRLPKNIARRRRLSLPSPPRWLSSRGSFTRAPALRFALPLCAEPLCLLRSERQLQPELHDSSASRADERISRGHVRRRSRESKRSRRRGIAPAQIPV